MSQAMEENLGLEALLQSTSDLLQKSLKVTCCLILRPAPDEKIKGCYVSKLTVGRERLLELCEDVSHYCHSLLVQGKPLVFPRIDSRLPLTIRKVALECQVRSMIVVPIFYQQSYLGEICLYVRQDEHQWTESALASVCLMATQWAIAIGQARGENRIQKGRQGQQLLHQIGQILNSSLEPRQILSGILRRVGESFEVDRVILVRLDGETMQVCQEWQTIPCGSWQELLALPFKARPGRVLDRWENPQLIPQEGDRCPHGFAIDLPIFIQEQFFGILTLETISRKRTFSSEEIETLEGIAVQTAIALHQIQNQERLEQLVQARIQELEAEKQGAETANRAKSQFLANMSHELRAPLTGILGFARMLREEIYGSLNQKQMQYVSAILASGQHLLELINDLLDLSKIEAGREELFLEKVPVEEICQASIWIVEERAREQGLELVLAIDPRINFCLADKLRLKQILVNLLSNAVKFTEVGSVTLEVKPNGNVLEFSVIDTGIGIGKADQEKLFQTFSQIDSHLNRKYKGTGLGLALSRKLARLHGGDLTAISEEGKGSCFTLHLPA